MLTDTAIADLLVLLYSPDAPTHPIFHFYEPGNGDGGICWALVKLDDEYVFLLRGSKTLEDWLRDLIALPRPFEHNLYGAVHQGFKIGMREAADEMIEHWDGKTPLTICGHSLGAGRAAIAVAEMIVAGVSPSLMRRVVFGEPKPGMSQLAEFIAAVPARSYRNGMGFHHDLVTDVPFTTPSLAYVHPTPLTLVEQAPDSLTAQLLDVFGFHHMPLYAAAVRALEAKKAAAIATLGSING